MPTTLTINGYDHAGKTAETIARRLYGRNAEVIRQYTRGNAYDFKIRKSGVTVARGIARGSE